MVRDRPLSRAESQERTRQALLVAAEHRFLNEGYLRTTLAEIAADAGVTKGAVYANFSSKAALFQQVRSAWTLRGQVEIQEVLAGTTDLDTFVETGATWMTEFGLASESRQQAIFEFLAEAEDAVAIHAFVDMFHATRAILRGILQDNLPRLTGCDVDEVTVALQVEVFLAALRGVAVHRRIDPTIPAEAYGTALRNLVGGTLAVCCPASDTGALRPLPRPARG